MSHEVETMAYAGELPWHGLGNPVSNDLTPEQMMEASGTNWNVLKVPDYIYIPGTNPPKLKKSGTFKLIRETDGRILTSVSGNWKPVQNSEAFEFFADYVKAGDLEMHTAGSLKNGEIVWVLAKIKDGFEILGGDVIEGNFLFTNFHQYGKSTNVRHCMERVVCKNTLEMAFKENLTSVRVNHARKFDAEAVKVQLGIAHNDLANYRELAEFLSSKRAKTDDVVDFLKLVFPRTSVDEEVLLDTDDNRASRGARLAYENLETQPGANFGEGTWWQAFNSVTYVTDHVLGHNADTRMASAWYGSGRARKQEAAKLAIEFAKKS